MSLSSINFSSYQNAITTAYARPGAAPARVQNVTPITRRAEPQTTVATGLAGLLTNLAAGDVGGSQAALKRLAENLRGAQATAEADSGSGLGAGFSRLLVRLGRSLEAGDTGPALGQIQNFLLDSGRATGTGFSATV